MSQLANIIAFDGAATPVSHTFVGEEVSRENGAVTARYKESLAGVPDYAQQRVTISKRKLKSGINQVDVRVETPVMESVSGQNAAGYTAAPKVAYIDTVVVTGYFHERSLVSGRRSTRKLAVNIAENISTTSAAATTGPVSEAFDQLLMPT